MISVLCPSRERVGQLAVSVTSLVRNAARDIEILVVADDDDLATIGAVPEIGPPARLLVTSRKGYGGLHEYYQLAAAAARASAGDWLMVWNDDARMVTPGWDTVIAAQQPGVLWMRANHCDGGNLFPAWPRAWSEALGHVSLVPHVDMWIQRLGSELGCQRRVDVEVLHDRKDVTGGHDDATYAEGRGPLGPNGMTGPFPDELVRADAAVIRSLGAVRML